MSNILSLIADHVVSNPPSVYDKKRAVDLANRALLEGIIKRKSCHHCGKIAEMHHEDYSKPIEIIWLCKKHHGQRHRELNKPFRKKQGRQYCIYFEHELAEQVEAYFSRQPFRPTMSKVVARLFKQLMSEESKTNKKREEV